MPIKRYKPTSPGRRDMSVVTFDDITATKPHKALLLRVEVAKNPFDMELSNLIGELSTRSDAFRTM